MDASGKPFRTGGSRAASLTVPDFRPRYRQMQVEFNPYSEADAGRASSHTYDYNPFDFE